MRKKNLIIGVVILILLVGLGILELVLIDNRFASFADELKALDEKTITQTVSVEDFDKTWDCWKKSRILLELFLNHLDIIEIEMRMAECHGYITNKDFESLHVQLTVLIELSSHVAHKCHPTVEHVL